MSAQTSLPEGLHTRVLDAARSARTPGAAVPALEPIRPLEAFGRAADSLFGVLSELNDPQWRMPALRDLDVQGLVGHLIAVEVDMHRAFAGDPAVADADHIASTQPRALEQAGRAAGQTRLDWRRAINRTVVLAGQAPDKAPIAIHGLRMCLGDLLVVRAFELWTHENDIRRAVGLAASAPDPQTLALMSALAAHMLPHGVARTGGLTSPLDLHLVLIGAGGGTWDLAMDGPAGKREAMTLVADVVDFCRLVANRLHPAEVHVEVDGVDRRTPILVGAASLALD